MERDSEVVVKWFGSGEVVWNMIVTRELDSTLSRAVWQCSSVALWHSGE